jgi:acyl-coenzyme A thioesterase PaaI-like protein
MIEIKQSSTHHCFVCGTKNSHGLKIKFFSDGNGYVFAHKTFSRDFQGYSGIVHGGVISAVLDEAAGRTPLKGIRPEAMIVTGKLEVKYIKPVLIGEPILIESKLIAHKGRVYIAKSTLKNSNGELLAEAEVTLIEPGKSLVDSITPSEDQWVDWENNGV